MKINKVVIENFRSIKKIEFNFMKHGNSYTTMLIGINESGKSNILTALSYFNTPQTQVDYNILHNQKDDENKYIDIWYYLNFENKDTYLKNIRKKIKNGELLDFKIDDITKNVYLGIEDTNFNEEYNYIIKDITKSIEIIKTKDSNANYTYEINKIKINEGTDNTVTEKKIKELFNDEILKIIKSYEPKVTLWSPSEKYLISNINLNDFKKNPDMNIPLKHIFAISGYKNNKQILEEIERIDNDQLRRKLMFKLSSETTKYVTKIWKHKIEFDIVIENSGMCIVSIKDAGNHNQFNFYKMNNRSEGFKQFMSLILSLSIEARELNKRNDLILIDEPEAHLHPSGIRDLREELLRIGKTNYLFIATHSPFLIDRKHKERNIIIKKNNNALTEKRILSDDEDLLDDEVLEIAFGINLYKDLLNPNRILVEGASDKVILQKLCALNKHYFSIINGTGSNIVQIAARLNHDDISILVITDDDNTGVQYKENILKTSGVFNENNVFTLRDLVGEMKNNGTMEDLLNKDYIKSKFCEIYASHFGKNCEIQLDEQPFVKQIKIFLQKNNEYSDTIINEFKKKVSNDLILNKKNIKDNFYLLDILWNKILDLLN